MNPILESLLNGDDADKDGQSNEKITDDSISGGLYGVSRERGDELIDDFETVHSELTELINAAGDGAREISPSAYYLEHAFPLAKTAGERSWISHCIGARMMEMRLVTHYSREHAELKRDNFLLKLELDRDE